LIKANTSSGSFSLIGKREKETVSATHIYVLVDLRERFEDGARF